MLTVKVTNQTRTGRITVTLVQTGPTSAYPASVWTFATSGPAGTVQTIVLKPTFATSGPAGTVQTIVLKPTTED